MQNAALQDYVLVEAQRQWVEVHSRSADGAWTTRAYGTGSLVALPSLAVDLAVAAVYEDVDVDGA